MADNLDFNQIFDDGFTPIMTANDDYMLQFLFNRGANINFMKDDNDKWGIWNVLMIEIFNAGLESIEFLVRNGVDLYVIGKDDYEGSVTGIPYGTMDVFDMVRYMNKNHSHDDIEKIIYDYLYQLEKEKYQKLKKSLSIFPNIIFNQIFRYLLHPEAKDMTQNDLEEQIK